MKTFDFIQVTISHNLKDPHSKALEPGRLFPFCLRLRLSLLEGRVEKTRPQGEG
jgi:hypothetical protein